MRRRALAALAGLLALLTVGVLVVYGGGGPQGPGTVHPHPLPGSAVDARAARQREVARPGDRPILFGDLHVHSTYSVDAFMRSLPLMGGRGLHPPADACDYARFCSGLDFFALTDHAESLTPRHWDDIRETMRRCNGVAAEGATPDLVAFTGFEWSQVGTTPEEHYGHKNVIFRDLEDERLPPRPIGAAGVTRGLRRVEPATSRRIEMALLPLRDFEHRDRYLDVPYLTRELAAVDACPEGVDTRELPPDCRESATTPAALFEKLEAWGFPALVIPHGTTWGFYTPPGYVWHEPVRSDGDAPARQGLVEVYSGHGNSEEYRSFRAVVTGADGPPACPEPTEGYEPCCHRAGELIRARCDDPEGATCEARVREARAIYAASGAAAHLTVPGATVADWAGCGQCTDCFAPAFNYRPGGSVQYMLARGDFTDPASPRHPTLGFLASSDNHSARPGTGFKEVHRRELTEAAGPVDEAARDFAFGPPAPPGPEATRFDRDVMLSRPVFQLVHLERQASFFLTGGLVAVHADARSREAIWSALEERRVYGTSGDRILLWFDLQNGPGGPAPMGAEVALSGTPRFTVRAAGAFEQLPGCPPPSVAGFPAERLERICVGECYHPGARRRRITRIEVVRIRPQTRDDEPIESLVDDPFLTLPCPDDAPACEVAFEDPEYASLGRTALYYVRAIQEPTAAVNGGGLRCDDEGESCSPCYGDYRTPRDDDCLTEVEERAWSSPIYVHPTPPGPGGQRRR